MFVLESLGCSCVGNVKLMDGNKNTWTTKVGTLVDISVCKCSCASLRPKQLTCVFTSFVIIWPVHTLEVPAL